MTQHLWHQFAGVAEQHGDRVAQRQRHGRTWEFDVLTYSELKEIVDTRAAALLELGVTVGSRVAILAHNSSEWIQADLALMSLGAITVPIYPTSTPDQCRHILRDSAAVAVLVQNGGQLTKILEIRDQLPTLKAIATLEKVSGEYAGDALYWGDLEPAMTVSRDLVEERRLKLCEEEIATIIYTSGTTGDPKGASLRHRNITAQFDSLDQLFTVTPEDHSLAFLPLSHALERGWTYFAMSHGCAITFCDSPKQVAEFLRRVKPTLFVSVPRLYEKIQQGAMEAVATSPTKAKIFEWALRVGGRCQRAHRKGKRPALFWRAQLPLADRLVLRKIRDAIGGPKAVLAAGGAPMRAELEEFFSSAGLMLCSGYGMTEASPLMSFNAPTDFKVGTVGRVMPGGEIRIGMDAEIFFRGPNVMAGYWNNDEATAETVDADGWLRTGDIGYIDIDGYLVITDRKKDILVTSGGKNIAPQPIEGEIMADSFFEHAVVLGNDRPFVTALLKPSKPQLEQMARDLQLKWQNLEDLLDDERLREEVRKRLSKLTEKLPSHEQIKDFRITLEEFTQENGLLTPTLKVKRREVDSQFKDRIDEMYTKLTAARRNRSE